MARRALQRRDPHDPHHPDGPERDEGPAPEDVDRFSGVTQNCPHCGIELYDDAAVCWKCGMAVTEPVKKGSTAWVVAVIVVLILAMVFWQIF